MRILTNQAIRTLFRQIVLLFVAFALLEATAVCLRLPCPALWVSGLAVCLAVAVLAVLYRYFRFQDRLLEKAVDQIHDYLSGNREARIPCDDEGELYRLFHEVNSLAAILNAHAENEERSRYFLKDTISDISHQLKTPLAALNIYNGLLQEEVRDTPALKEFTDLSEQELDRIQTLVQNLLKMAKLDAGTLVLEKREENLAEMMGAIQRHFAYRAEQEKKTLVLATDNTLTLSCDRTWLLEALSNIVKNAFDHTREGCTIRIAWKGFASMVQITVRDDGSGISPEDLPHIFKRFYRSRFSQDTRGIGLGLSLAKAIIEAHNGTIEVDSTPGMGTTFTINFLIPTKM